MKKRYIILFFLLQISNLSQATNNCISWDWNARTGDQLLCYCIAKWVSYNLNVPLLIKPFKYFDKFVFSQQEVHFNYEKVKTLKTKKISHGYKNRIVAFDSDFEEENTLFIVDLFFAHAQWYTVDAMLKKNILFPYFLHYSPLMRNALCESTRVRFDHMLRFFKRDQKFFSLLKASLQTIEPLETVEIPKDSISVALHVRKGGGYDQPYKSDQLYQTTLHINNYLDYFAYTNNVKNNKFLRDRRDRMIPQITWQGCAATVGYHDLFVPLKHTPDQFYIDQLKALDRILDLPLFVYIFTDDQNPEAIAACYERELASKNITFCYRKDGNNHYSNVLNDMFSMAKFDILIRSSSSFSQMSQLLGNHKLVISPLHALWDGNRLVIDELLLEKSDEFDDFIGKFSRKHDEGDVV